MKETILFIFFVILFIVGLRLVWHRSGNHDVDFITKLAGWLLLIPAILGLFETLRII